MMSSRDAEHYKFKYNVLYIEKGKAIRSELELNRKYLDCSMAPFRLPFERIISFRLNDSSKKKYSDRVIVFHGADYEIVAESREQRNAIAKSFLALLGSNQKKKRDFEESLDAQTSRELVINDDLKELERKQTTGLEMRFKKEQSKNKKLQSELAEMHTKFKNETQQMRDELRQKVEELNQSREQIQVQMQTSKADLDDAKQISQHLELEHQQKLAAINANEMKYDSLHAEFLRQKEDLHKNQVATQKIQKQQVLKEQQYESDIDGKRQEIDALRDELKTKVEEIRNFELQSLKDQTNLNSQKEIIAAMKQEKESLLQHEEYHRNDVKMMQTKLKQEQSEHQQLERILKGKHRMINQKLREMLKENQKRKQEFLNTTAKLKSVIDFKKFEIKQKEEELKHLQNEINELTQAAQSALTDENRSMREFQDLKNEYQQNLEMISAQEKELRMLRIQLAQMKERIDEDKLNLQNQNQMKTKQDENQEEVLKMKDDEIEELKNELNKKIEEVRNMQTQLFRYETNSKSQREMLDLEKEANESLLKDLESSKNQEIATASRFNQKQMECENIRKQMNEEHQIIKEKLQKLIQSMKARENELLNEVLTLKTLIVSKDDELNQIQTQTETKLQKKHEDVLKIKDDEISALQNELNKKIEEIRNMQIELLRCKTYSKDDELNQFQDQLKRKSKEIELKEQLADKLRFDLNQQKQNDNQKLDEVEMFEHAWFEVPPLQKKAELKPLRDQIQGNSKEIEAEGDKIEKNNADYRDENPSAELRSIKKPIKFESAPEDEHSFHLLKTSSKQQDEDQIQVQVETKEDDETHEGSLKTKDVELLKLQAMIEKDEELNKIINESDIELQKLRDAVAAKDEMLKEFIKLKEDEWVKPETFSDDRDEELNKANEVMDVELQVMRDAVNQNDEMLKDNLTLKDEKLKELKKHLSQKDAEIQNLGDEMMRKTEESDSKENDSKETFLKLQEQLKKLQDDSGTESSAQQSNNFELSAEIHQLQKHLEEERLKSDTSLIPKEKGSLTVNHDHCINERENAGRKVKELKMNLRELEKNHEMQREEILQMKLIVTFLKEKIKVMQKDEHEKQQFIQKNDLMNDVEFRKLQEEFQREREEWQSKENDFTETLSKLQKEMNALREVLQNENVANQNIQSNLEAEIQQLQEQLKNNKLKYNELLVEKDVQLKKANNVKNSELQEFKNALNEKVQMREELLKKKDDEIIALKNELNKKLEDFRPMQIKLLRCETNSKSQREMLDLERQGNKSLLKDRESSKNQEIVLTERLNQKQTECQNLRDQIQLIDEHQSIKKKLNEALKKRERETIDEVLALKSLVDSKDGELNQIQDQLKRKCKESELKEQLVDKLRFDLNQQKQDDNQKLDKVEMSEVTPLQKKAEVKSLRNQIQRYSETTEADDDKIEKSNAVYRDENPSVELRSSKEPSKVESAPEEGHSFAQLKAPSHKHDEDLNNVIEMKEVGLQQLRDTLKKRDDLHGVAGELHLQQHLDLIKSNAEESSKDKELIQVLELRLLQDHNKVNLYKQICDLEMENKKITSELKDAKIEQLEKELRFTKRKPINDLKRTQRNHLRDRNESETMKHHEDAQRRDDDDLKLEKEKQRLLGLMLNATNDVERMRRDLRTNSKNLKDLRRNSSNEPQIFHNVHHAHNVKKHQQKMRRKLIKFLDEAEEQSHTRSGNVIRIRKKRA